MRKLLTKALTQRYLPGATEAAEDLLPDSVEELRELVRTLQAQNHALTQPHAPPLLPANGPFEQSQYHQFFHRNVQPMWLFDTHSLAFVAVNDAAVAAYGYSRPEFLAMRITDIRPPKDAARLAELVRAQRLTAGAYNGDWQHRKKDGTLIDVVVTSHGFVPAGGQQLKLVMAHDVTQQRQSAARIGHQEALLTAILNASSDLVLAIDRQRRVIAFNEPMRTRIHDTFGIALVLGTDSLSFVPPAMHADHLALYQRVFGGESVKLEKQYRTLDDQVVLLEESVNPIRDADGTITGLTTTVRNVTDRRRAEDALRLREAQLSSIVNNTDDYILAVDDQQRLTFFNDTFARDAQTPAGIGASVGMPLVDLVRPEELARYHAIAVRVLAGERVPSEGVSFAPTREPVYLERAHNPIRNERDEVVGFSIFSRNVTQRHRAEEALREREAQLSSIVNNTDDPIISTDGRGVVTAFNQAAQRIVARSGFALAVGKALAVCLPPPLAPFYEKTRARVLAGERVVKVVSHQLAGREVFLEHAFNPVRNAAGAVVAITSFSRNVTERVRTANALQQNSARLAAIMESTQDAVFAFDTQLNYTSFNQRHAHNVRKRYGVDISLGTSTLDYLTDETARAQVRADAERALGGDRFVGERSYPSRHPDQPPHHYEIAYNPIRALDGAVAEVSVFVHNITERKRRETSLIYRENVLKSIFHESADAICLTNEDFVVIDCNQRTIGLFDLRDKANLLGKPATAFHRRPLTARKAEVYAYIIRKRGLLQGELEYLTDRGQPFWGHCVCKRIRVLGQHYVLIRVTDITARKAAETQIQQSNAQLKGILESIHNVAFAVDRNARLINFNRACQEAARQLLGVEPRIGEDVMEYLRQSVASYAQGEDDLTRALRGEQFVEERRYGQTGTYYELAFNPIRDGHDEVIGVAVLASDITERKTAETRLVKSLLEKDVLLSEVYHRVKNNLNVVVSLLNLQAIRSADREVIGALTESKNRVFAMALVHEQLYRSNDLAHLNTQDYVHNLVRNIQQSYATQPGNVQLRIEVDPHLVLPLDLAISLGLILNELLSNCFKHAFPGQRPGTVGVWLQRAGPLAGCLRVWDDGVGCDPPGGSPPYAKRLGLTIVEMLVAQVRGTLRQDTAYRSPDGEVVNATVIEFDLRYPV